MTVAEGEPTYDELCVGIRRRLVNHRLARRMNVNQAAKLAGLSRTGLEKMENGDVQPSLESLARLAKLYGEGLASFLEGVESDLGVARRERARLFAKETKRQESEALLLELAVRLGLSGWLDEWKLLSALSEADEPLAESLRKIIHALVPGGAARGKD